jgi:hypothetical protein
MALKECSMSKRAYKTYSKEFKVDAVIGFRVKTLPNFLYSGISKKNGVGEQLSLIFE